MAEIWLARVRALAGIERYVAVKLMRPELASETEFVRMFFDEVRISVMLEQPNVVRVYDVGEADGAYFIAMEYLHGADLQQLVEAAKRQSARLPIEHSLCILIRVCAGLHYAHELTGYDGQPLGVVHRDISLRNVMVTLDGAVKLLDFGVAKALKRATCTEVGVAKGKVPFMAPEQLTAEPVDRRCDIHAVGALLYELTVGRPAFAGDTDFEIATNVVEGRYTPPSQCLPGYPGELEEVVVRAMALLPGDRYQSARELQVALEQVAEARQLDVSGRELGAFVRGVVGDLPEPWHDLRASADADSGGSRSDSRVKTQLSSCGDGGDHAKASLPRKRGARRAAAAVLGGTMTVTALLGAGSLIPLAAQSESSPPAPEGEAGQQRPRDALKLPPAPAAEWVGPPAPEGLQVAQDAAVREVVTPSRRAIEARHDQKIGSRKAPAGGPERSAVSARSAPRAPDAARGSAPSRGEEATDAISESDFDQRYRSVGATLHALVDVLDASSFKGYRERYMSISYARALREPELRQRAYAELGELAAVLETAAAGDTP